MKQRHVEQVKERLGSRLAADEQLETVVVAIRGAWQYMVLTLIVASLVVSQVSDERGWQPVALLLGVFCALQMRPVAFALSDRALYVVELKKGSTAEPAAFQPAAAAAVKRRLLLLSYGGATYWAQPIYLFGEIAELERGLAAGPA